MELSTYLPGRLGNPDLDLVDDPRLDPRLVEAFAAMPLQQTTIEINNQSSYNDILAYCEEAEKLGRELHPIQFSAMPTFPTVTTQTIVIDGVDGNSIQLYLHQPHNPTSNMPCIVHTHGGGMAFLTAADPNYVRWRNSLAEQGILVVGVEFRNAAGQLGNHPFPAGLNDCASAIQWVTAQRDDLGIGNIVISGESGGGNLSLATALKANREGWINQIQGVYAQCPYISGLYANPPAELLSLIENDTYLLSCSMMGALVKTYDPNDTLRHEALAWPLSAKQPDLEGLPPHIISVNELDPLRDEGLAYFRKLLHAEVSAVCHTIHGTPHGADMNFADITPDTYANSVRMVTQFAYSL